MSPEQIDYGKQETTPNKWLEIDVKRLKVSGVVAIIGNTVVWYNDIEGH